MVIFVARPLPTSITVVASKVVAIVAVRFTCPVHPFKHSVKMTSVVADSINSSPSSGDHQHRNLHTRYLPFAY